MAINWKNGVGGSFTDPTAWDAGHVPGSGDDAVVGVAGNYTVSLTAALTVNSITITDSGATLGMVTPGVNDTVTNGVSNSGTVDVEFGAALSVGGSFTNGGTLELDDQGNSRGSSLTVGGNLTNSGTIRIAKAGNTGGSMLAVTGTFDNGGTLDIGQDGLAAAVTVTAGTLTGGGSISLNGNFQGASNQAMLTVGSAAPGTLSTTITLRGDALLQYGSGAITAITSSGSLTLQGSQAQIVVKNVSGNNSALNGLTSNAGTFDLEYGASYNTGMGVSFTNSGTVDIDDLQGNSRGSSLSVGGDLTNASGAFIRIAHDAGGPGGSMLAVTGTLDNKGTLAIGRDDLAAPVTVTAGALTGGGSISLNGNFQGASNQAMLTVGSAAPGTLSTTITLRGDALLQYGSGAITAITSSGSLTLQGSQAQIAIKGVSGNNSALDGLTSNAGTFDLEYGASYSTGAGVSFTNSGTVDIDDLQGNSRGSSVSVGGDLTSASGAFIRIAHDAGGPGGSMLAVTGTLDNKGTLAIGRDDLVAPVTVTAGALSGAGSIYLNGNFQGASNQAMLTVGSAAPGTLSTTITLRGDALLQYGSGAITMIASAGSLTLQGSQAQITVKNVSGNNSALNGLTSNAGTLDLEYGASYSTGTAVSFTNSGTVDIDDLQGNSRGSSLSVGGDLTNTSAGLIRIAYNAGAPGGSMLAVTGTLNNSGTLDIGRDDLAAPVTVTAGALSGAGSIYLNGNFQGASNQAMLTVGSAAPGTLSTTITLRGDALLQYGSGAITTIASAGSLTLQGSQAQITVKNVSGNNSALNGLTSNAGTLDLEYGASYSTGTAVSFTNSGTVDIDDLQGNSRGSSLSVGGDLTNTSAGLIRIAYNAGAPGGSMLAVTGTLNNSGTLDIGRDDLAAPVTVTAGALSGAGSIYLNGNFQGASNQAMLTVGSAAPGTLSTTITLRGDALLQYGSGAITTIASAGALTLQGSQAQITVKNVSGNNSALNGLTSNAGTLDLEYGASYSTGTAVSFTNSGTVDIDDLQGNSRGSSLSVGGDLTNTSAGLIRIAYNAGAPGGSMLAVTGTLNNSGTLDIGRDDLAAPVTVTAGALSGAGSIYLNGNFQGASNQAMLTVGSAAPGTLSTTITLRGDALLQYGSGAITTIASAGSLTLQGSQAQITVKNVSGNNSALNGLTSNAGTLDLEYGASYSTGTGVTFTNSGTLDIDDLQGNSRGSSVSVGGDLTNTSGGLIRIAYNAGAPGGSMLAVTGTLNNSGTLDIGRSDLAATVTITAGSLTNTGTIGLTGASALHLAQMTISGAISNSGAITIGQYADVNVQGTLSGTGSLTIGANGTFELRGASASTITFSGTGGTFKLGDPENFTGTIAGFALGDTLDLENTAAIGAYISGQTLTVTLQGGATETFTLTGNFSGESFLTTPSGADTDITLILGADVPPVTTVPATALVTAGETNAISGISIADSDAANTNKTITVTLSDAAGQLAATTNVAGGGGSIAGSGTSQVTISGSLAQVNADLTTLTYRNATYGTDTIDVATTDHRGGSDDHTIAVTVNAPPVTTVPGAQSLPAGVAAKISGISVADADGGSAGETITVALSDTAGALSANTGATGGGGTITGAGTKNLTISGTLAQVDADLTTVTYFAGTPGTDAIDVATNDGRGGSDDHAIAVTAVGNAPPVTTVPAAQSVPAALATPITGISVADADAVAAGETITVRVSDATGKLAANGSAPGGGGTITGAGTKELTIAGSLGEVNADLTSLTYLASAAGTDSIDVATNDGRGGSDDHTIAVTADNAAQAAIAQVSGLGTLTQNGNATTLDLGTIAQNSGPVDLGFAIRNVAASPADTLAGSFTVSGASAFTNIGFGAFTGLAAGAADTAPQVQLTTGTAGPVSETITLAPQDVSGTGNTAALPAETLTITADLEPLPPPVITAPASQTVFAGMPAVLGPLSIADANGGPVTVTISAGSGTLTATAAGSAKVSGSGSNKLTLEGDVEDINTELAAVTYIGGSAGADAIVIQVVDLHNASAMQSVPVAIDPVPVTSPVIDIPAAEEVVAGRSSALGGINVSDPYAEATGQPISIEFVAPSSGSFTANGIGATVSGENTNQLTITGPVAAINSYFADSIDEFAASEGGAGEEAALPAASPEQQAINKIFEQISNIQNNPTLSPETKKEIIAEAIKTLKGLIENSGGSLFSLLTFDFNSPADAIFEELDSTSSTSSTSGKVHIVSAGGLEYELNASGDFVLAESVQPNDVFEMQVRMQPLDGSASASVITQTAILIGNDVVNLAAGGGASAKIDGALVLLNQENPVMLSGGRLVQVSTNTCELILNSGEVLNVTDYGSYLDLSISFPSSDLPGTVIGLAGPNGEGPADAFTLPDGTVLSQNSLTTSELYNSFANAWRVPNGVSLFDTPPPVIDPNFPEVPVTLNNLPAALVAQGESAATAAGLTDQGAIKATAFDYAVSGGDPSLVASDAAAFQGLTTTPANITASGSAPVAIGVYSSSQQTAGTDEEVTFEVYLTAPAQTDTTIDYQLNSPNGTFLTAAAFGGTPPSGQVTIAAGQTTADFTIDVPFSALGTNPSENLGVAVTSLDGVPLFAPDAQAEIVNPPTAGPPPEPEIADLTNFGTFTHSGNTYTLDLGALQLGQFLPALNFAVINAAALGADEIGGSFSVASVAGYTVTGASLPQPIAAGQDYEGLTVTPNEEKINSESTETITFTPTDTNATGYSAPLSPLTLTIEDTIVPPTMYYSTAWGDVHIITYNGLEYDFQAEGEFTLAKSSLPNDTFDIQLRMSNAGPNIWGQYVSVITQTAVSVGTDRVTFDPTRPDFVEVDGIASTISMADPVVNLSGGKLVEISPTQFQVTWNTGEEMTVTSPGTFLGRTPYLNVTDGIPFAELGHVAGLQGEGEGQANDFQLPDGTVLQQPLSSTTLYGEYANAWRVTPATSLFDYLPGYTTANYTDLNYPADALSLADLPAAEVAKAAQLVAAAGITDPGIAQAAEYDYLATGDTSFITSAANVAQQGFTTTNADVKELPTSALLSVLAVPPGYVESATGPTPVTFDVYLSQGIGSDTTVNYTVVDGGTGFIGTSAFGGTLPSGQITLPALATSGQFTIDVPQGVLGNLVNENLEVRISSADGTKIFAPTAVATIANNTPEPGTPAEPMLAELSGGGTFTFDAATNTYTLDLGTVTPAQVAQPVQFAVVNAATAPADDLSGTFSAPLGSGFIITGNTLPGAIAAGQSYQGLYASIEANAYGANSETLTFNPQDVNDSGYSAALPALTLIINDTVESSAQPRVNTPTTIIFPNARLGAAESQAVSITNTATAPAGNLDVTMTSGGDATATGSITGLAPGVTDATDLRVGLLTNSAGARSGAVTVNYVSDAGNGQAAPLMTDTYIDVFGSVYALAQYAVTRALTVHVGDSGTQNLTITNVDPNNGYSENLLATVVGTTGGVTASGSTGDIAPGMAGTLAVNFSTATPGAVGTVTLDLQSDGTSIDGLGTYDLGTVTIPVAVTLANVPAAAQFKEISGGGTFGHNGNAYTLALGTIAAPVTVNLGVLNSATAPANPLSGSFVVTGDSSFVNAGFGGFAGIASGTADTAPTVTLDTGVAGTFSETITLTPSDTTTSAALPVETLTITGTVATATPMAIATPGSITVQQGVAYAVPGVSLTDPDTGATVTVTLFDNAGQLAADTSAPGGGGTITGSASHALTISGTLAQVNADLTWLTDTDSVVQPDSIAISASDSIGATAAPATIAVTVGGALAAQVSLTAATEGEALTNTTVATFTDTNAADLASAFTASINWGDGTTTTGLVSGSNGAFSVTDSHTYAEEGAEPLAVTIRRTTDGAQLAPGGTVTVADAPLMAAGATISATEGLSTGTVAVATLTDANPNAAASDFSATIDWGDGSSSAGAVVANPAGGFSVEGSHAYAEDGQDNISVAIADAGGSTASAGSTAQVADAPLSAAGVNVSTTEGLSTGTVTVATFRDANPNATAGDFSATIDWGDGSASTGTVVANPAGGFGVQGSHTYAEEGQDDISVAIADAGGSTASAGSTAQVADAPLTASGLTLSLTQGAAFTGLVASFTDANLNAPAGDFSATIDWGDGKSTPGTVIAGANGGFGVQGTHSYAGAGQDAIDVTIADAGGSTASAGSTANVAPSNAPPVITAPAALTTYPGHLSTVGGVSIADADAVSANETFTVSLTDSLGKLFDTARAAGGGGTITGNATASLTISGTLAQVNADLSALGYAESSSLADQIIVNAQDNRGGKAAPQAIFVGHETVVKPAAYGMPISGLGLGDELDLSGLKFSGNATVGFSGDTSRGTLSVHSGTQTANLTLLGNYMAASFVPSSDGAGGTVISDTTPNAGQQAVLAYPSHG